VIAMDKRTPKPMDLYQLKYRTISKPMGFIMG
jgi:hypothetical protein